MGLIMDLLTLPASGGPRLVHWLARTLGEEAEQQLAAEEEGIRGELLVLQQRYEAGEMGEEDYDRQEIALLEHLADIRELKTNLRGQM